MKVGADSAVAVSKFDGEVVLATMGNVDEMKMGHQLMKAALMERGDLMKMGPWILQMLLAASMH